MNHLIFSEKYVIMLYREVKNCNYIGRGQRPLHGLLAGVGRVVAKTMLHHTPK
jgi:hypothetical protein